MIAMLLISSLVNSQNFPGGTPNKKASELFGQALKANDMMEYEKAIELLEKALNKDENFKDAWSFKGDIYQKLRQYDQALEAYSRVLALQPDDVIAIIETGKIHIHLHQYDESLKFLRQLENRRDLQNLQNEFDLLLQTAEFGAVAIKNPVPFVPVNMGPKINTEQEEYFPSLTVDEQSFFFTRRDASVPLQVQNEDLYMSGKDSSGGWEEGENLGQPVNTLENEAAFCTTPDGRYLFFTACSREGGKGGCDIWLTWKVGKLWVVPVNIGSPINTLHWETQPAIAPDGITLYFVSNRPGGYGGSDIWKSVFMDSIWSEPENLGPEVNTAYDEQFPFIHADGQTLYFVSAGHPGMGKWDIFVTKMKDNGWSTPVNLGYPINSSGDEFNFVVSRKGTKAYFASENREGGYGGMDIYEMDLYEDVRPQTVSYVQGKVYDASNGRKLSAKIELVRLSDGSLVSSTWSDDKTGLFTISLPSNNRYAFKVEKEKYLLYSANFSLEQTSGDEPYLLDIPLQPIKLNADVVLENIFFETNKYDLHPDSKAELEYFAEFLKKNAGIKVQISGHTDNVGSDADNQVLSENRAKAVFNYLTELGIDASRLTYKGYGATKPRDTNETEEGRAKNRRTEFRITGL